VSPCGFGGLGVSDVPFLIGPEVWPPPEFLAVIALLIGGLIATVLLYRRAPSRRRKVAVIVVAVALATASGVYGALFYQDYQLNYSWQFNYHVSILANGTSPESLIVPVPQDQALLGELTLQSGQANWSFVSTPYGRGLFVRFTGGAELDTYVIMRPPLDSQASTDPTMTAPSNCTVGIANCTGAPQLWMYYSGSSGARVLLVLGWLGLQTYPEAGWARYNPRTFPP
jgi:hypothetical protein